MATAMRSLLESGPQPRRSSKVTVAWWAVGLLTAVLAWPSFEQGVAQLLRGLCTLVLSPLRFGQGGHVEFLASQLQTDVERAATWDLRMMLRIEGVAQVHSIALNSRRLLALPLASFGLVVAAVPVRWPRKRWALGLAVPLLSLLAVSSVWLVAVFLFSQVEGLVYSLSPTQAALLRLGYEGWVTPLANKFIVPLLLAALLLAWPERSRRSESAQEPASSQDQADLAASRHDAARARTSRSPAQRAPKAASGRRRKAKSAGRRA